MTVNISVQVIGDHWCNREEFIENLKNANPDQQIILNLNAEGPCLHSIGLCEIIDTWLTKHNKSPKTVFIDHWSNDVEYVPYSVIGEKRAFHFFEYSQHYYPDNMITANADAKLFGLFLGRHTIARNSILYYVANNWADHFLLSQMKNANPNPWPYSGHDSTNLENIDEWIPIDEKSKIIEWISQCPIPSLDNKLVQDQYKIVEKSSAECNQSLLKYYDQFNIELVCESYTIGNTFFPTEKTVRPIATGKPILVYGPKNFLERLSKLGFKTYAECWDESYDYLEGPERWKAIIKIIDYLINLNNNQLSDVLKIANLVAMHNRQHLLTLNDN